MKPRTWLPLLALLILALSFGCEAKKEKTPEKETPAAEQEKEKEKEAPAPEKKEPLAVEGEGQNEVKVEKVEANPDAAPAAVEAAAFFQECQSLGAVGAMGKYSAGLTITGPMMKTSAGAMGDHQVLLSVDDTTWPTGHWISLAFADQGEAAKAKNPQAGDTLTAQCQLSAQSPKHITLNGCVLK